MQLYELEKRMTMNIKALAKDHDIDMTRIYVNIQTGKGMMGFYRQESWRNGTDGNYHELALNPEHFNEPLEVIDTMMHELVHIYCDQKGIKDTSRQGYYHNQRFKKVAEEWGLKCIPTQNGWNTSAKDNREFLEKINSTLPYPLTWDMMYRRPESAKRSATTGAKRKHTYICPGCNLEIKHKDIIFIRCLKCGMMLELDEDDPQHNMWEEELQDSGIEEY